MYLKIPITAPVTVSIMCACHTCSAHYGIYSTAWSHCNVLSAPGAGARTDCEHIEQQP